MDADPQSVLREELRTIPAGDVQELLEYIPLASRLASLGDPAALLRWRELATVCKDFPSALRDRCQEGIWDLQNSFSEDLGLAVIASQDFACFARREADILPAENRRLLAAWRELAEEAPLDEDAAQVLRSFLEQFPLPQADRLAIVDSPVTELVKAVVASQASPRPTVKTQWQTVSVPEPAYLDDVSPSAGLKRFFETETEAEVEGVGRLVIRRSVSDEWKLVVDIAIPDGPLPQVDLVRVGLIPALRSEDCDIDRWVLDLRTFPHSERRSIMHRPIVILFDNNYRLEVT